MSKRPTDNFDSDTCPLPFASLLESEKVSQRGQDSAILGGIGTIPSHPALHPNQLASRDVVLRQNLGRRASH